MSDEGYGPAGTESVEDFLSYGRMDWYSAKLTFGWSRLLHYVQPEELKTEHRKDIEQNWAVFIPVRLACGKRAGNFSIAGILTRMSARRCPGCCRATGMPQGRQSPKNDPACRALLGLTP